MTIEFTNRLDQNIDLLGRLMADLPPQSKARAKDAGRSIMRVVEDLQRAHPKDAATNIGIALSAALLLQQLTEGKSATDPTESPQIQLLS